MENPTPHSNLVSLQVTSYLPHVFKKSCFFLFIICLIIIFLVGLVVVITMFVLKPKTPYFSVQTIKIESYKLDLTSSMNLFVSSYISLTLDASNPNKVGINYIPSRFYLLQNGLVSGIIRVEKFMQPPQSENVTMQVEMVIDSVNISQITNSDSQMRLLGDIIAQLQVFHVTLPKVKIAMDCDIKIDHNHLTLTNKMFNILALKDHMMSNDSASNMLSKRCSFAVYM
ncbi:hypothetical protein Leryth_011389 [Lithospermum erythrorhizon]|nr:hypothetical protein Leryth_011389 [Lithospermum erythrorhizon]